MPTCLSQTANPMGRTAGTHGPSPPCCHHSPCHPPPRRGINCCEHHLPAPRKPGQTLSTMSQWSPAHPAPLGAPQVSSPLPAGSCALPAPQRRSGWQTLPELAAVTHRCRLALQPGASTPRPCTLPRPRAGLRILIGECIYTLSPAQSGADFCSLEAASAPGFVQLALDGRLLHNRFATGASVGRPGPAVSGGPGQGRGAPGPLPRAEPPRARAAPPPARPGPAAPPTATAGANGDHDPAGPAARRAHGAPSPAPSTPTAAPQPDSCTSPPKPPVPPSLTPHQGPPMPPPLPGPSSPLPMLSPLPSPVHFPGASLPRTPLRAGPPEPRDRGPGRCRRLQPLPLPPGAADSPSGLSRAEIAAPAGPTRPASARPPPAPAAPRTRHAAEGPPLGPGAPRCHPRRPHGGVCAGSSVPGVPCGVPAGHLGAESPRPGASQGAGRRDLGAGREPG
ncbi:basic proline-rich protein-like [Lathamus discolor]|uniref:basic proline-rich protein-like n=1 Tax=Lathamus discolor TaxID=678569 RepID=UPI0032B85F33